MVDHLDTGRRSENMSKIRSKNTRPEMVVRKLVHRLGYRFRLHSSELPGKPDIVFSKRKKVIFVHGCFWHLHEADDCKRGRLPKTNVDYWKSKLRGNRKRDLENLRQLSAMGWQALIVWECGTTNEFVMQNKIKNFLGPAKYCGKI